MKKTLALPSPKTLPAKPAPKKRPRYKILHENDIVTLTKNLRPENNLTVYVGNLNDPDGTMKGWLDINTWHAPKENIYTLSMPFGVNLEGLHKLHQALGEVLRVLPTKGIF